VGTLAKNLATAKLVTSEQVLLRSENLAAEQQKTWEISHEMIADSEQ
jgi:hypothetical protein